MRPSGRDREVVAGRTLLRDEGQTRAPAAGHEPAATLAVHVPGSLEASARALEPGLDGGRQLGAGFALDASLGGRLRSK